MKNAASGWNAASFFRRTYRIVRYPRAEWDAIRAESPRWSSVVLGHVLPLSFLPALGWATGLALTGVLSREAESVGRAFAASVALTVLLSVLCVILLALAFYLLAPLYETERNWNRAFRVAGYGTTPVLLAGVLLVMPIMVLASMVAMLHNFLLYYVGLQKVMGCRQAAAAEYLALSCVLAAMASSAVGAAGGALGIH